MSATAPASANDAPRGYWCLRPAGLTLLVHRRGAWAGLLLTAMILAIATGSLSSGTIPLAETVAALAGIGDPVTLFMLHELRVPRLVAGLLSGAALGVGGCLLQTLARNRLATPGIIGIDDGATAFAVASIVAIPTSLAPPMLALMGAATAAALAFGLGGGGSRGYRFIVVGIAIGALFGAITNFMLARTDIDAANLAYPWTVGSLNARSATTVATLAACLAVCLPIAKILGRDLQLLRFSDAIAIGLGTRLRRTRIAILIVTVFVTATAVAVAGPVGLVSLAAPEIARHLTGHRGVPVINSALAGALLMIAADWAGRTAFAPVEIPVGVITAVVGGPYLLWILLREPRPGGG
ncbi:iron ABC transporter permease [Alcaligenaceae bacterium]|nr:iron ABC transporter permease [Alcaligenaceae bacterium]